MDGDDHLAVHLRGAQSEDARDARDDDAIATGDQGTRCCQSQAFDFLVDRGVFLDVKILLGDIGFRLVVVVVTDEIVDGVAREELSEFGVQLRSERLVVAQDQRRPLDLLDDVGHRKCLP